MTATLQLTVDNILSWVCNTQPGTTMVDCHQPQGAPCKYSQCHGLAVQPDSWPIVYSLIGSAKLPCFRTAQACLITVVKISLLTESDIILRMLYSLIAFIDCYLLTFL